MDDAFNYTIANSGLDGEDTYQYYGIDEACWKDGEARAVASFRAFHDVPQNSSATGPGEACEACWQYRGRPSKKPHSM